MSNMYLGGIIAGVFLAFMVLVFLVFARLYKRSTKESAFVRTGMGGQKVVLDGGALVLPVLHETIPINMTTLKLTVTRHDKQSLITSDRMRVDVTAEFFVRVKSDVEAIASAAQTLGSRTTNPDTLRELIEAKFVDALRSVAASMNMSDLHEKRADFVQKVQHVVASDINKNGLELESVSLTGLDQTKVFDENNVFDAVGMTAIQTIVENNRRKRNDTIRQTEIEMAERNLAATQRTMELHREEELTRLKTERELAESRALQESQIAVFSSAKRRDAAVADQEAERAIAAERLATEESIAKRTTERNQAIEMAEQTRAITVAERSKAQSSAEAAAAEARALSVKAEESVITARQEAEATRKKIIEIIDAERKAEQDATGVRVSAAAELAATRDRSEALVIEATARTKASQLDAEGALAKYDAEAKGRNQLNAAENMLNPEILSLRIKEILIAQLPAIITAATDPMKNIDSIKIVDVAGLNQTLGSGNAEGSSSQGSGGTDLPTQVVNAALRHSVASPMLSGLMSDVGLGEGGLNLSSITNACSDMLGQGGSKSAKATRSSDSKTSPVQS